jgi:exodeoxyribonuclease V alpha subunit
VKQRRARCIKENKEEKEIPGKKPAAEKPDAFAEQSTSHTANAAPGRLVRRTGPEALSAGSMAEKPGFFDRRKNKRETRMAQEQEWQTLSGTVENIVYCNEENGYTVLEFSSGGDLYTAVGELSDVNVGEDVTLHGRFVTHPSFGEQFRVEACEVRMPESATAIRRYLASGALPYIGKALAGRIVMFSARMRWRSSPAIPWR